MADNTLNETDSNDYVWEPNRKSPAGLPSSEHTMDEKRREMIRKALEFDIVDVRSYVGYRGDMLVEFTTLMEDTVMSLKKAAEALEMEVAVRRDPLLVYQVYCITPADDIYELKI